jgi:sugar lactone lactonase YvrE
LDATESVAGTFVYTPAAGTILNAGTNTLSTTFTPTNPLYGQVTATVQLVVNPVQSEIIWPTPAAITYGTPLSGFQLDATASSGTIPVPLSGYYNVSGIYSPGSTYGSGGFDNDGYSYSTTTLGSTVVWNGMTFDIGPPNAQDAVANLTIPLPAGNFTNLFMLGAMVNNISAGQTFVVTYTDGTTTTLNQNMSDWVYAKGWPGESVVNCNFDRNFDNGTTQPDSVCVYGYQIPLNSAKIVQSIQLPATRNIVMLAMDLTTPAIPGTFVYTPPAGTIEPVGTDTLSVVFTPTNTTDYTSATASVQLVVDPPVTPIETTTIAWPTPANIVYGTALSSVQLDAVATAGSRPTPVTPSSQVSVLSTSTDGTSYLLSGFDGNGHTYSYKQLNNGSVNYAGATFTLGQPTVPNALTNGAVYTLGAPGNYSSVYLIGAANATGQINEPFILTYANGTVTQTVSMSSWSSSAGYAGETIITSTPYANTSSGGEISGTYDLYGYQITADPTRTLQSVTLPSTTTVVIMALGFGTNNQIVVPGTYVYNPVSGTVLPVGTWPLSVAFTPTNTAAYTSATDSVNITVVKATPIITWPTPAAVPVGTVLSSTQLDATASVPGTFTYTPAAGTVLNTAGTVTLNVTFVPTDSADYTNATDSVQLVVGDTGSFGISGAAVFPNGDCCFFNQPTPYTITVTGSVAAPTGTVEVIFNGQTIGTGTLVTGSGATSYANLSVTSSSFYPGTSGNAVTLSYLGDTNYAPNTSPATIYLRNPAIGVNAPPTVGQSTTTLVPYTFVANGAININFNPQSAPSTDFTDGGTGTCQSGTQELAGTVCSLSVAFKPSLPGARRGAIEIDFTPAGGGAAEPTLYLFPYGMGDAAQISLSSATQSVLNSSLSEPQSVAFNPAVTNSTLYVANSDAKEIVTLPTSGGAFTQWNAANTTDLVYPSDLAYDAFDDLVVSDANAAMVVLYTPAEVQEAVSTGTFTLGLPTAVKVDLGGNLYIADAGSTPRIIQVPGEAYAPNQVNLGSQSVSFPQAMAVDNVGLNLYVGDGNLNEILDIGLSGTGTTTTVTQYPIAPCDSTVTSCALNSPGGIAFDLNGDMFITDSSQRVLMAPSTHLSPTNTPTTLVPMTGLTNPSGITLDASGNIYVSDLSGTVTKLWVNAGALSFVGKSVGSTLTTNVTNIGNLPLTISKMAFTSGASFSETDNCTGVSIAAGGSCTITVTYTNATGDNSDTLTLTSNAYSASGVTIQLSH